MTKGVERWYLGEEGDNDEQLEEIINGSRKSKAKINKKARIENRKKEVKEKEKDSFEAKEAI